MNGRAEAGSRLCKGVSAGLYLAWPPLECILSCCKEKTPQSCGVLDDHHSGRESVAELLRRNLGGLKTLGPLFHFKFDRLALSQCFKAVTLDGRKMYEYICAAVGWGNKSKPFGLVKPFNGTCNHSALTSSNKLTKRIQLPIIKGFIQELPLGASE
jgi:hypothetical protein